MAVFVGASSSSGQSSSSSESSGCSPFAYDSDSEFDELGVVGAVPEPPRLAYWNGLLEAHNFDGTRKVLHELCDFLAHNELVTVAHVRKARDPSGWLGGAEVAPAVLRWIKLLREDKAEALVVLRGTRSRSPPACRQAVSVCAILVCMCALHSGTARLQYALHTRGSSPRRLTLRGLAHAQL